MNNSHHGKKFLALTLAAAAGILLFLEPALAATLELKPAAGNLSVGREVTVEVVIDSVGQSVNAAQAAILFPKDKLEVVSANKEGSIFNFWLEEPSFSNAEGTIKFIGGIQAGISGGSLRVLTITFKTKTSGLALLSFEDAAVTASDGSGTNLLSIVNGASYAIFPREVIPPPESSTVATTTPTLTPPPPVKRTPVPAKTLPAKPKITAELYPEQTRWYNTASPFLIRWELPPDISGINTLLNHEIASFPPPLSKGLTEGELVGALKDGIWYFHVRFQNNVGWGETTHYKISLDTVPPLPFTIEAPEGVKSDNPRPIIRFRSQDALSGIDFYDIRVDNGERLETRNAEFTLPLQKPGTHRVTAKAFDRAGNNREAGIDLEITPIPAPIVTYITPFVTLGSEERFTIKGLSAASQIVHVNIMDRKDQLVVDEITTAGGTGEWVYTLAKDLRKGEYLARVWSEDSRGALSLPVQAGAVIVKVKPAVKLGTLELSMGELFSTVILAGVLLGLFLWYSMKKKEELRRLRYGLVEYDFYKMLNLLEKDIAVLKEKFGEETVDLERLRQESSYVVSSLTETLKKIKTYFSKEVDKLKK